MHVLADAQLLLMALPDTPVVTDLCLRLLTDAPNRFICVSLHTLICGRWSAAGACKAEKLLSQHDLQTLPSTSAHCVQVALPQMQARKRSTGTLAAAGKASAARAAGTKRAPGQGTAGSPRWSAAEDT